MANKPLKSIKFPGLADTYTVPQVDNTLAVTGAAADAKKVGDEITSVKQDLSDISDDIYTKTLMTANSTASGWKLKDNGYCASDSSYKMDKYQVTSGDVVKIVSDHLFQFQTSSSVPSGGSLNRVGDTYGAGTFKMVVPETATYLIVSTTISDTNVAVYALTPTINDLIDDVNSISSHVGDIDKDLEKSKTYELAVQNQLGNDGAQIIDLSGLTPSNYGTSYKYYNITSLSFTVNGDYYPNPLGECSIIRVYALDANGNRLKYNETNSDNFSVNAWAKFTRVNDRKIVVTNYASESNFKIRKIGTEISYEYAVDIAAIKIEFLKNSTFNNPTDLGITRDFPSNVYIPYGYAPRYNPWMIDAIWDGFVSDKKFYNVPAKRLNPWMQRSYTLTDNLLDDRKIDWGVTSGNYYTMKYGETVPVEGGRTVVCSKSMYNVRSYDENGTETVLSNTGWKTPLTLPNDAVSIRFDIWRGTGDNAIPVDEYQPVYLYYADDVLLNPLDDVDRNPVPMAQINGWDINNNIYDKAIPEVGSNIVRMMKTFAIRELNHQRNAFRVGTFNIYVNNTRTNRSTIKKELETYGIDICGFQEARNLDESGGQLNIGDYLKGWQFGYCNTNEGLSGNGRAIVSAYQVLTSEEVVFTDNTGNSYLHCTIKLPTYKHYSNGDTTLSLYNYHGDSASATARAEQVAQIIAAIGQDTSDFIIVLGDTNDFPEDHPNWQSFRNAGLTPVHDGSSRTTTDGWSIDQIFVSEHITCLYYDVVDSRNWKYKPTPTSALQPVSDHDFLYADLKFDFEAVLEARNNS